MEVSLFLRAYQQTQGTVERRREGRRSVDVLAADVLTDALKEGDARMSKAHLNSTNTFS